MKSMGGYCRLSLLILEDLGPWKIMKLEGGEGRGSMNIPILLCHVNWLGSFLGLYWARDAAGRA